MDSLLSRLNLLLPPVEDSTEQSTSIENSKGGPKTPLRQLLEWNEAIEGHFPVVSSACPIVRHAASLKEQLPSLSKQVLRIFIIVLSDKAYPELYDLLIQPINTHHDDDVLIESAVGCCEDQIHIDEPPLPGGDSVLILRTAQNWLRFYIQAILAHAPPSSLANDPIIADWSHPPKLLKLYLCLMEAPYFDDVVHIKYASQILFFATFPNPLPYYESYLIETHRLCERLLGLLVQRYAGSSSVGVWLSLVRNVHNALAGYNCKAAVEAASTLLPASGWSWLPPSDGDGVDGSVVTYATVLRDLALHVLETTERERGEIAREKQLRTELIVEILRCCYVLRIPDIHSDDRWRTLINLLWQQDNTDIRITTASILTAVPSSFCAHVAPQTLLNILKEAAEQQASQNIVDDRSAAAITPLLALLHKYCSEQASYCTDVRAVLFPNVLLATQSPPRARNSSPLDTPPGTLRHSIVQLLTSPQGHVKRLVGEWLWIVCDEDMNEFIRRVGMGNALPLLSLKGLVTLPTSLQQHS